MLSKCLQFLKGMTTYWTRTLNLKHDTVYFSKDKTPEITTLNKQKILVKFLFSYSDNQMASYATL